MNGYLKLPPRWVFANVAPLILPAAQVPRPGSGDCSADALTTWPSGFTFTASFSVPFADGYLSPHEKMLDFTYVDDCVEGVARGIEALASGRVVNETINLAYGSGRSLVRAAQLIGAELGVDPQMTVAPPLVGEVTHYVADLSKAGSLLGYEPKVSLDAGIPRAVEWFLARRAVHPEEEELVPHEAATVELA